MLEPVQMAKSLTAAERAVDPIDPFTDAHPDLSLEDARRVQGLVVQARLDGGESVVGTRIGFTSQAKREASGLTSPVFGALTSDMLHPYGSPVDLQALIQPRAEPEIALLLARELAPPATVTSVLAATEVVLGAVDVIDSRYRGFRYRAPDVAADNVSAGRVLLGSRAIHPSHLEDLRLIGCVVRVDGEVAATAAAGAALGHPAAAVAWLVNSGETLPGGSLVLTGGLTAAVPLRAGHAITVEFDGLGAMDVYG
jgi:2-oxo-3-hexenedioate decarboxylase